MTVFVLVAAVVVLGAIALALTGRPGFGRPLAPPVDTLPPVQLPEDPQSADVDRLRFSPALRGYRMDQVDQVLDRLASALEQRDRQIAELQDELARSGPDRRDGTPTTAPATGAPSEHDPPGD